MSNKLHIALLGNPNSGKTSLFNALTGLNQKVGNFPGVTVEKKTGECRLDGDTRAEILDLPGSYSLYPRRADEWVAYKAIMDPFSDFHIDVVVVIVDASNLRRNLLYASQVADLNKPVVVALTMMDLVESKGIHIDVEKLSQELGKPIVVINPRKNEGIGELKRKILATAKQTITPSYFVALGEMSKEPVMAMKELFPEMSDYSAVHYLINHESMSFDAKLQDRIEKIEKDNQFNHTKVQADEILRRYNRISTIIENTVTEVKQEKRSLPQRFDKILLHKVWGYAIMFFVLFFLFQSIFWAAEYPMTAIEWGFGKLSQWLNDVLEPSWFSDLLVNGIVAGLSGILVFVPQIMILFGLITFLEDTGYMARISFLTDKIMRKVGLNGKSVMPMISSLACAVPAIMSTRNIENKKERLLTIMITPLMSCSARLPVYTILIALVIPRQTLFGVLSLQGLVMMSLYLLGFVMAMLVAYVMKWFIKLEEKSFFILELPLYRPPRWKNIFITMFQKAKIFVFDAGKVIMVISLLLWALSSYGPSTKNDNTGQPSAQVTEIDQSRIKLENSYAGIAGKWIEPVIEPLGFDWKIGIALITSFAAREVFVGTMATLYSVEDGEGDNNLTLRQKMNAAVKPDGSKVYSLATGVSLMIFYVLAMQCMSTLAIVKRETGSWKWAMIQLVYMTALAYILSLVAYQALK